MGLIKTAIMSGVGVYGISKLAKTAEHRTDSRTDSHNANPPNYNQYPPQASREAPGYYGPPQAPREDAHYGDYPEQQRQGQWYPPQGQQREFASEDSGEGRYNDKNHAYRERQQFSDPPAYNQQPQGYQQQPPYEQRERTSQSGLAGGFAQLAPMALEYVQHRGDGKKLTKERNSGNRLGALSALLGK